MSELFCSPYAPLVASSIGFAGTWFTRLGWGWKVLGGVVFLMGAAVTGPIFWDKYGPHTSDELWIKYKSTSDPKERISLIEKLRKNGDDTAVKHLGEIFTLPGSGQKEWSAAEAALDTILEERGVWKRLNFDAIDKKRKFFTREENALLEQALPFPTRGNIFRFLKIPRNVDYVAHPPHGNEYFISDVHFANMAKINPLTVVETLLEKDQISKAAYVVDRLWPLLPKSLNQTEETRQSFGQAAPYQIYYVGGRVAEAEGKWQEAAQYYERSVKRNPNFLQAHFRLGRVYAERGLAGEAVREFQAAIQTGEEKEKLFDEAVFITLQSQNPKIALELVQQIHWRDFVAPSERDLYLGYQEHLKGNYSAAISFYETFLENHPGHPRAHYSLGMAYWRSGTKDHGKKAEEILGALAEELKTAPLPEKNRDEERHFRASVFHGAGMTFIKTDPKRAEGYFEQTVELYPSNEGKARVYTDMGHLYDSMLSDYSKALALYDRALALHPYSLAMFNRTHALRKLGREKDAKMELLAFVKEKNHPVDLRGSAYSELSDIELVRKRWKEALEFAKKSVETDEACVYGYWNMMEAYRGMGKYREAIEACDRTMQQRRMHPENLEEEIEELMGIRKELGEKLEKGGEK